MKGSVILSHGLESGPEATKVKALAEVADELGWNSIRPDYREIDADRYPWAIDKRIAHLLAHVPVNGRIILGGSSLGAFVSGFASLKCRCEGLFLMALPMAIPAYANFDAAAVPTTLVHGWRDELCPVAEIVTFARRRGDTLHLVADTHRLSTHVVFCADAFRQLLMQLN